MAYTTQEKIENYLLLDIDLSFSDQIDDWIASAEQYIDNYCGRTFDDVGEETRGYDGDNTRELLVDDFYSLSKIEIYDLDGNKEYTVDTNYYAYPSNDSTKWRLVLDPTESPYFIRGFQNVKVTANWGWQSVPKDIEIAATKLVASVIEEKNREIAGDAQKESIGDYSITYADIADKANSLEVENLLDAYKRPVL